jgi:hypothetical protein
MVRPPRTSYMYTGLTPESDGRTRMVFAAVFNDGRGSPLVAYALNRGPHSRTERVDEHRQAAGPHPLPSSSRT